MSHLEWLAARVENDPFFLAAAIRGFQRSLKIGEQDVAEKLGCPLGSLSALRLCRMPAMDAPQFSRDVEQIAEHFALDADALAEVVRLGQAVVGLQAAQANTDDRADYLMAARDEEMAEEPPAGREPA